MPTGGRIAIIGASPVGCIIAAGLVEAGQDVTLVDGDAGLLAAIGKSGLAIEGALQVDARPRALYPSTAATVEAGERFDTAFVCVKTVALAEVLGSLPLALTAEGTAIRILNGLDTEKPLLELLGPRRCLRGVTHFAGNFREPGRVTMDFFDPPNYLGAAVPGEAVAEAQAHRIAALLSAARLEFEPSADIRVRVWELVIRYSAMLPITALTGMDVAQVMGSPRALQLVKGLLGEAIAVAAKVGFRLDERFLYDTLTYYLKAGHHLPSMWSDVRRGRRTEIEVLNHRIAEYGELYGIDVPYQRAVANLVLCIDELAALDRRPAR